MTTILVFFCGREIVDRKSKSRSETKKGASETVSAEKTEIKRGTEEEERVFFQGRVEELRYLAVYTGKAITTHFDPHFILSIRILKSSPDHAVFSPELIKNFAIHSPTHVFIKVESSKDYKGRSYEFSIEKKRDGRWRKLIAEKEI